METNGERPPTNETALQLQEILQSIAYLERRMVPLWHVYKHTDMYRTLVKQRHPGVDISKADQLRDKVVAQATNLIRFAASEVSKPPSEDGAQIIFHPSARERLDQRPNFDVLRWMSYGGKRGNYALETLRVQFNNQTIEDPHAPPMLVVDQFTVHGPHPAHLRQIQMLTFVNNQAYVPFVYETELSSESHYRLEYHPAETAPEYVTAFWSTCQLMAEQEGRKRT